MNKEKIIEYYNNHKGEVIGSGIGLVFAICVLFLNILKMLFIAICVFAGYYFGKKIYKDKNYFRDLFDRLLRFFNI